VEHQRPEGVAGQGRDEQEEGQEAEHEGDSPQDTQPVAPVWQRIPPHRRRRLPRAGVLGRLVARHVGWHGAGPQSSSGGCFFCVVKTTTVTTTAAMMRCRKKGYDALSVRR
jgi:hypothetical protein